ncbi:hypothetical protein IQ60_00115 [Streptomyces europaeiscabiei]|nr:hypothetical protein IQ60_00115 [Streptomyces europaeiscabiei]
MGLFGLHPALPERHRVMLETRPGFAAAPLCGAGLPNDSVAGRRYCDAACRAQAYRERRAAERMFSIAVLLGEALETGDRATVRAPTCLRNGHVRRRRTPQ